MAYTKPYEDKTKELLEKLEKGILDTMNSEGYKAFLNFQSKFHSYSYNNQILIHLQRPNASMVSGYNAWSKFERHVIKGEKAISILAPSPYKYTKEIDKIDPKTKQNIKTANGENQKEKVEMQRNSFKKVSVFDVSQTEGKELPSICKELGGNSTNSESIIRAIKKISEVKIIEEEIKSGAKGYYLRSHLGRSEDYIALNKGMSLDQTAKTLIHESAHSQLHSTDSGSQLDRATKEVQAESVAYVVSNHFGVDTSQYTFDYLANWSSGKELKELKESFNLIQKTSDKFINKIEEVFKRELELQNSPAKVKIIFSEGGNFQEGQTFNFKEASEIFDKLDHEQSELRKSNPKIDSTKVTAGEMGMTPYASYLKTKFQLELADGTIKEARFDIGESGYKNFADCVKVECGVDVEKYIKEYEIKLVDESFNKLSKSGSLAQDAQEQKDDAAYIEANKNVAETTSFETNVETYNSKESIVDFYKKELPAIKHITEKTAVTMSTLNKVKGHPLTIKQIKGLYTRAGKKVENGPTKENMQDYRLLSEVVDDIKHAKLVEKQEKAHEKALENPISKSKSMDMVQ
ncbi:ArdC-like ssDNA-binding domain-containing protein [Clostridium estertheticum]|uniref:ArdC-like ssDNA-binding domain-containing protein n=1 Tax=Clostridium estertheticum TaxID=238834 RepID=UPI001C0B3AB5|nr:ArdC-like ssDNA-binding domain-containing protein [Clostridium estertheticum]MBU3173359.1 hypothetical protein [Clostridium estertheticum]